MCLAVVTTLPALPRLLAPASWRRAGDYGLTGVEVVTGLLFAALVLVALVICLYAAIRSALRPAFRRDGTTLGAVSVLAVAGWILALWLTN